MYKRWEDNIMWVIFVGLLLTMLLGAVSHCAHNATASTPGCEMNSVKKQGLEIG